MKLTDCQLEQERIQKPVIYQRRSFTYKSALDDGSRIFQPIHETQNQDLNETIQSFSVIPYLVEVTRYAVLVFWLKVMKSLDSLHINYLHKVKKNHLEKVVLFWTEKHEPHYSLYSQKEAPKNESNTIHPYPEMFSL